MTWSRSGALGAKARKFQAKKHWNYAGHQYDSHDAAKGEDGVWRPGAGCERDYGDPREEHDSYRDWLVSGVPAELTVTEPPSEEWKAIIREINSSTDELHVEARPMVKPNWSKWAEAAGLDEWENRVLQYRLAGRSRDRALAEQPDEDSRKAIQAAWKRFERNGMERLREAAKINFEKNVPEQVFGDTSK